MVAGDDHHLALAAECAAELTQHRIGGGQRPVQGSVAQLEHVAQQDQPVELADGGDERSAGRIGPQDVAP